MYIHFGPMLYTQSKKLYKLYKVFAIVYTLEANVVHIEQKVVQNVQGFRYYVYTWDRV